MEQDQLAKFCRPIIAAFLLMIAICCIMILATMRPAGATEHRMLVAAASGTTMDQVVEVRRHRHHHRRHDDRRHAPDGGVQTPPVSFPTSVTVMVRTIEISPWKPEAPDIRDASLHAVIISLITASPYWPDYVAFEAGRGRVDWPLLAATPYRARTVVAQR